MLYRINYVLTKQNKNMKNIIKNVLLYFSAFIPMYFLIVVKFIFGMLSQTIPVKPLTVFTLILYSVLIIIGILGLLWNILWNKEKAVTINIQSSQNITDQHFLGYFSLFVLFALSFELTKLSMFIVSLVIIIFIGIVYINNEMYYINPFLNLLGYNFYNITYLQEGQTESKTAKMFYKGKLDITKQKTFKAKIKNSHFSFIDKK